MQLIPVLRPTLPSADAIFPWLRIIDENHWYANFGPLETRLRESFAALLGLSADNVALFSNGTAALSVGLRVLTGSRGGLCVMPSWTHVGTVSAVCAAGLTPWLTDCDEQSWSLTPQHVREVERSPSAVMPVAPFGADFDYDGWDRYSRETDVPVLIDAAAGFDRVVAHGGEFRWGATPVMVSLHATKTFGVGEGGLLICGDPEFIRQAQMLSNFGIYNQTLDGEAFSNSKMSEYSAAVGLAGLNGWSSRRARLAEIASRYLSILSQLGIGFAPGFGGRFVSSTCMISVSGSTADELERHLSAHSIETKRWWRLGLHRHPQFAHLRSSEMTVTNRIASSFIGIPHFADLTDDEILRVASALSRISVEVRAEPVAHRA